MVRMVATPVATGFIDHLYQPFYYSSRNIITSFKVFRFQQPLSLSNSPTGKRYGSPSRGNRLCETQFINTIIQQYRVQLIAIYNNRLYS